SAQQFEEMYPDVKGKPIEWVDLTLRYIPVAEVNFEIRLPSGFMLADTPRLSVLNPDGSYENRLIDIYRSTLAFSRESNTIFVRLAYPPLGLTYRIEWALKDEPP